MCKRIAAARLAIFENKYGKLSRSQRRYIAMKVEKRINEMRDEYFEKNN